LGADKGGFQRKERKGFFLPKSPTGQALIKPSSIRKAL